MIFSLRLEKDLFYVKYNFPFAKYDRELFYTIKDTL